MKRIRLLFFVLMLEIVSGCTEPIDVYLRNFSGKTLHIIGHVLRQQSFRHLPNQVNVYKLPPGNNAIVGKWIEQSYLNWRDSLRFDFAMPDSTVVDLSELSERFTLGIPMPAMDLSITAGEKTEHLFAGEYSDIYQKFRVEKKFFGRRTYYYDYGLNPAQSR